MPERLSRRRSIIVAGTLFVCPLAVTAFRSPSCHPHLRRHVEQPGIALPWKACRSLDDTDLLRKTSNSVDVIRCGSSVISHGSDAERQRTPGASVDSSNVDESTTVELERPVITDADIKFEKRDKQSNREYQLKKNTLGLQHQKNSAFSDTSFIRKRTETLLEATASFLNDSIDVVDCGESYASFKKKDFDWLLDAWGRSGQRDAANMAVALLNRMEELRDASTCAVKISPDVRTYTKVINVISRSGRQTAGEEAEAVLERMIKYSHSIESSDVNLTANTIIYTYVADAYARSHSPRSPENAQRIVDTMEQLRFNGDPEVRPTARAWNSVILAWSHWEGRAQGEASGAERAEACLKVMETLANTTGNEEVRPNFYNYNSVISAWAHSGEIGAASRAEKILEKMESLYRSSGDENVKPRTATYNAIIDAWAKSGEVDMAKRAELLLGHMMELYETGHNLDAKPNVRSFNSVLNAWAKSGDMMAPDRARELLAKMEDLALSEGENGVRGLDVAPDATSFATAINAYARSYMAGKAESAYKLFQHMKELYDATGKESLQPNNVVFNSVLNACAFSMGDLEEQSKAMEIASSMLVELGESPHGSPDQVTYGTYLKVIANQMPASNARSQIVQAVFKKCARSGVVGEMVLRQLRDMSIKGETYKKCVGKSVHDEISLHELPSSWTCNIVEGKRKRRRQFRRQ
mmetsp:Transcript_9397/g.19449  ORF Transcript_9397/g.19449 Transcript_9397/m.19449 type:complete len:697 (-) Transcript_9397:68-2158(-)